MKNTVMSSLWQSVLTARFLLGVIFVAAAVFLASIETILDAFRSEELLAYGFHGSFVLKAVTSDTIILCLPIVCALPYAASYVDDVKTGFIKLFLHRTSRRGYILGKTLGCVISGGLVVALGLFLAYAAAALVFLPMETAPQPDAENPEYFRDLLSVCGLFFLSGGLWSLFALTMSSSGSVTVEVAQTVEVELSPFYIASDVNAGDTIQLAFQVLNLGRGPIYNVRVELDVPGLSPTGTAFIGNMGSGASAEAAMNVFVGMKEGGERYGYTSGVTAPGYLEIKEQAIQDFLGINGVVDASGLLEVSAAVTGGSYTANLDLTGIDGAYLDVTYIRGGTFPEEGAMPWMVLSEAAAGSFTDPDKKAQTKTDELPPIDWLSADFALQTGEIAVAAKISGLVEEKGAVGYISQNIARELLQRQGQSGAYSAAAVRITDMGAAEAVAKQITALGYSVENMDTARREKWDGQLREAVYLLLLGVVIFACSALLKRVDRLKH